MWRSLRFPPLQGEGRGGDGGASRPKAALFLIRGHLCSSVVYLCFSEVMPMCRNIRPLFNFDPPVTDDEVRAAALQYVRKVSGTQRPSGKNFARFERAVRDITSITRRLIESLETVAPPRSRQAEAASARARSARRFGREP